MNIVDTVLRHFNWLSGQWYISTLNVYYESMTERRCDDAATSIEEEDSLDVIRL